MCCLGFEAKQLYNLKDSDLFDVGNPGDIEGVSLMIPMPFPDLLEPYPLNPSRVYVNNLCQHLITLNDKPDLCDADRERLLKEEFAKRGIDVEFIN